MARIAAAVFEDQVSAERALDVLAGMGLAPDSVDSFVLNPPGHHDTCPVGGDEDADDDARAGDRGALRGAALGGAFGILAGALATPIAGPAGLAGGIAAGAYAGALAGALATMGKRDDPGVRPFGVMVTVNLDRARNDERVLDALYDGGAQMIERAHGEWRNGHWADFDPVARAEHVEFTERASRH
jgi:hypothetical protein